MYSFPIGQCSLDHRILNVFSIEPEMEMVIVHVFIAIQAILWTLETPFDQSHITK